MRRRNELRKTRICNIYYSVFLNWAIGTVETLFLSNPIVGHRGTSSEVLEVVFFDKILKKQ